MDLSMPGALNEEGQNCRSRIVASTLILLLGLAACPWAWSQDGYLGRPVHDVLEALRDQGVPLVYSSNLVTPELRVIHEPGGTDLIEIAREILAPHRLALDPQNGVYVVIRADSVSSPAPPSESARTGGADSPADDSGPLELEPLSVSASHYLLVSSSQFFVDQRAIQALPDLGEDPLRAAQRLPGSAASGLSSRSHFRGGEHDETAIYLNGLQLLDPFHIRDYHSIFSSIDARAVSGVEAYTGGFPAQYGDLMSGVLALESQRPEEPRHTELGLSVYNTSLLHSGYSRDDRWDWLLSARESNLDVILNSDLGEPDYFDVFGQLGFQFSEASRVSLNVLYADDAVVVITESEPSELERSDSDTRNSHVWLRLDNEWSPMLFSSTVLSLSALENTRVARMNDPEKMVARAFDRRTADIWGLKQDWAWSPWPDHELRWGVEYREQEARYRYEGEVEYFGFLAGMPGLEDARAYEIGTAPSGHSLSFFASDLWTVAASTWLQYGLRWDRQTWTTPEFDDQLSPRLSLLHRFGDRTDLRLSWGRYYQSQAIHRLQVEDNVEQFFRPQRSDHFIAGLQHRTGDGWRWRVEAFLKKYDRLKPRFENLFDPLALIPELAPDRVRLEPTSARVRGIEFSLERRDEGPFGWWLTYVWSRASDRINGRDELRSWDQRHALQAGASWEREPWEAGLAISVHSGWPTTPVSVGFEDSEDEYVPLPGPRNSDRLGDYFSLDFRIARQIAVRKGHLSAFFEVSNATNRKNQCCVDLDLSDGTDPDLLDRTLDFWVPIIPAVGILWEF